MFLGTLSSMRISFTVEYVIFGDGNNLFHVYFDELLSCFFQKIGNLKKKIWNNVDLIE